jgi:DNA (cytosine-5)-methyltransferase 1
MEIKFEADYPSGGQKTGIMAIGGVCRTLNASDYKQPASVVIPCLTPDRVEKRQNGRRFKEDGEPEFTLTSQDIHGVGVEVRVEDVSGAMSGYEYSISDGIASSLTTSDQRKIFGSKQSRTMPCLKIQEATKQGYSEAHVGDSINLSMPDSKTRRGRVGGGVAQTLDTQCNQGTMKVIQGIVPNEEHPGMMVELAPDCHVYAVWYEKYQCYISIRKLTPKECFRLQGWDDEYFERARFVNSDSQLYKQAGNGVTVNVVYEIGKRINAG